MSSYQFVNSLTSCYGQPRAGPEAAAQAGANPADYYTPQVYNNCYASAANTAVTGSAQPTSPAYSAYLQNGDHSSHHSSHHHSSHPHVSSHHRELHPYSSNSCSQSAQAVVQSRLSHHSSAPILPSRTPTSPSSCKYAVDSASSPQDLSTSSGGAGQSPEPRATPPQRSSAGQTQPNSGNTAQQTNTSGANGGQAKNGNYGSSNPPHIYPWMRKVHVGQSKSPTSLLPVRIPVSLACCLEPPVSAGLVPVLSRSSGVSSPVGVALREHNTSDSRVSLSRQQSDELKSRNAEFWSAESFLTGEDGCKFRWYHLCQA